MPTELELDNRLRNQEVKAAEHDGRSKTFWEDQHKFNKSTLETMQKLADATQKLADRTNKIEKRLIWVVGFASGAGGLLGFSVSKTMGLL